jgi:hypothetical protein
MVEQEKSLKVEKPLNKSLKVRTDVLPLSQKKVILASKKSITFNFNQIYLTKY